jgi:uncharacterized protein YfdQ (DUF2303 family)
LTENFEVVSDLAERLADAEAGIVYEDDQRGYAVRRDARVIDWSNHLPTPTRRSSDVVMHDPTEFGAYVRRFYTPDTVLYADRENARVTAVFDDHPASPADLPRAVDAPSAWRRDRATLVLSHSADWRAWVAQDERYTGQREFGELIDMLRHNIAVPDAATMLEIATTLKAKVSIDYNSRTNVGNGDTSFTVTRETNAKAGRTGTLDIPDEFVLALPVFDGTAPVEVRARLRFRPLGDDGVQLGYRIRQRADVIARSFTELRADIVAGFGEGGDTLPIFAGSAP